MLYEVITGLTGKVEFRVADAQDLLFEDTILDTVITRESVDQLGLTEGMAACGAFKASAVLLCSQD